MGTCFSIRKDHLNSTKRFQYRVARKAMKGSLNRKDSAGESISKSKPIEFGSKEETFFDAHTWLDSESEDDFVSVDGDFTSSGGSTPNYQINNPRTLQQDEASPVNTLPDTRSELSSTSRKVKISELLKEKKQSEQVETEQYASNGKLRNNGKLYNCQLDVDRLPRRLNRISYRSGTNSACSSHLIPNRDLKRHKGDCEV